MNVKYIYLTHSHRKENNAERTASDDAQAFVHTRVEALLGLAVFSLHFSRQQRKIKY